ncbi:MAG: glycosyltransferase [Candidatus Omnitrophica bacterium]|nr:glycosyltransferase [Candidatus Omnitrophota bacterium]MDD5545671.1 glycosyltransferase [Candidatus Omnitrophota bacterium]
MSAKKRVLLLYISVNSGHQRAALAIEKALRLLAPEAEILAVNSFNYTNPLVEKVINRTYLGVIKNKPEVWEYLYDNPKVFRSLGRLRDSIHKFNSGKLKILLDEFKPDVIACTQAFPCGMIADYKTSFGLKVPLIGVLTDCYPHSYWFFDSVDHYIVNSEAATKRLIEHGIPREKIKDYGIPIDPKFTENVDDEVVRKKLGLNPGLPTVLIMGGNQGLGPLAELVNELNRISCPLQLIVVAGSNKRLFDWLERKKRLLRFKMVVYGFTSEVTELMSVSTLIVTKPGGLTISEALSKELPIIILNPIPGQEAKNTEYLTSEGAAVKADSAADAALLTEMLLVNKSKLEHMRGNARRIAKPRSSTDIARLILECANS